MKKKTSKLWRENSNENVETIWSKFLYIFGFINKYESKNIFVYKSNALFCYLLILP